MANRIYAYFHLQRKRKLFQVYIALVCEIMKWGMLKKKPQKTLGQIKKPFKKFKLIRCREMNERTFQHPAKYTGCIHFYNNAIISLWNLSEQNSGLEFIKLGSSIFLWQNPFWYNFSKHSLMWCRDQTEEILTRCECKGYGGWEYSWEGCFIKPQ